MPTTTPGTAVVTLTDGVAQTLRPKPSRRIPMRQVSRSDASHSLPRADFPGTAKRASTANAAMLQERARIARELHDTVSQTLYAITLTASRALGLLKQNEGNEVQHLIDDVLRLATAGQSELRALLTNIRSDRLPPGGLTAGLANLVAAVRTAPGLEHCPARRLPIGRWRAATAKLPGTYAVQRGGPPVER